MKTHGKIRKKTRDVVIRLGSICFVSTFPYSLCCDPLWVESHLHGNKYKDLLIHPHTGRERIVNLQTFLSPIGIELGYINGKEDDS